jgi:hypothetical protein
MRLSLIAICITLTLPAVWAQKYPRRTASTGPGAPAHFSLKFRSLKVHPLSSTPKATNGIASGVVQVFLNPVSGALDAAYFIATADIPSGTQIGGSITLLDDQSAIDFQPFTLQQDLQAGSYVTLPTISNFGDVFFQAGASFDYTVVLTPTRGASTQADGTFLLGETLANSDLPNFEPAIGSAIQSLSSSGDVILRLTGYYTGNPVQVVLSDLFSNYVVASGAITVSGSEVDIDMSQIQGFDLTSLDSLLVSVNDSGFTDSVAFRYLPPAPGTYNPAPQ